MVPPPPAITFCSGCKFFDPVTSLCHRFPPQSITKQNFGDAVLWPKMDPAIDWCGEAK